MSDCTEKMYKQAEVALKQERSMPLRDFHPVTVAVPCRDLLQVLDRLRRAEEVLREPTVRLSYAPHGETTDCTWTCAWCDAPVTEHTPDCAWLRWQRWYASFNKEIGTVPTK